MNVIAAVPPVAVMTTRRLQHIMQASLFTLMACSAVAASAKGPPAADPQAVALIRDLGLKEASIASRDLPNWKPLRRIVVSRLDAGQLNQLQAAAPGVEVLAAATGEALQAQLSEAQAVIGLCDQATLDAAPGLQWIQTWWVGVERCVATPGLAERGIVLTNTQRTSGIPIAEHAVAMMMSLNRNLPAAMKQQLKGNWQAPENQTGPRELTGSTMLVVGLGGIGTEIARRAHGLGMRVIATRNSSREGPDFVARVGLPDELQALAREADVVVNAVPLTPETTAIFDRKFFSVVKPGALFINIARGGSVVTDDLVAALRSGQIAGAGLDVTDPEPLTANHPLWSMDNVIITPHVAADSRVQAERYRLLVIENLRRYVAGEALLNVVDIQRGY